MAEDTDFSALTERYEKFVADRDWEAAHTPKNVAEALSIEASELLELFLWRDSDPAEAVAADDELLVAVRDELADVVIYAIAMGNTLDIDIEDAVAAKMNRNEERFPAESADDSA